MNFRQLRYISKKLSESRKGSRFLNFARLVALISVMIGSIALILSLSVLNGFEKMLFEKAVYFTSHIVIKSFNKKLIINYQQKLDSLKSTFSSVKSAYPVIEREALIRSKSGIEGVIVKGITGSYFNANIKKNIITGRLIKNGNYTAKPQPQSKRRMQNSVLTIPFSQGDNVIIGKRLADKLGINLNDEIVIYSLMNLSSGGIPNPKIVHLKVWAIYETGMAQYDDIVIYTTIDEARRLFDIPPNSVTSIEIFVNDISKIDGLSKQIEKSLRFPYYTMTVFDLHNAIFAWIELQKEPIPIVLGLITIVAVLNIVTTLLITVVEKTHSIGILRSLGMRNRDIIFIFITQGLTLGMIGTAIGSAIGYIICFLQNEFGIVRLEGNIYFLDTLPIEISIWHYFLVIGVSMLFAFLSTLIPSYTAVKITPLRALRFK